MSVIRFPPYVDLREGKPPMASFVGLFRRLFHRRRRANMAKLRLDRIRRYS